MAVEKRLGRQDDAVQAEAALRRLLVDELVENLVERNVIAVNGAFTVSLVDGGITVKGDALSTLRDQKKNRAILRVKIPVEAELKVGEIVIPLPAIP